MKRRALLGGLLALLATGCSDSTSLIQESIDSGALGRPATKQEQPKLTTKDGTRLLVFPDKFGGMTVELMHDGRALLSVKGKESTAYVASSPEVLASTGPGTFEFPAGDSILLIAFKRSDMPELSVYWTDIKTL